MSADIEPLRGDWGAKAAAGDALARVPNEASFIGIWVELEDGKPVVKWSKAHVDYKEYCFMALALMEFAQKMVREAMERE